MRGQQLGQCVSKLRAELGRSTNVAVGVDDAEILKDVIRRTQETLYEDYDWSFLRQMFPAITLNAGQRYYDIPAAFNFDRIEEAAIRISGRPVPFIRGIEFENYTTFDSDAGVRASPAQRWDIRWTGTVEQIEVWPIPTDSSNAMQFKGIRKLRALTADSDVTDLDDNLIILFAAAELLARQKSEDANIKLKAGQQLYARLKGRSAAGRPDIRLGMGTPTMRPYRATVAISGR